MKKRCKNALLSNVLDAVKEAELREPRPLRSGRIFSEPNDPVDDMDLGPGIAVFLSLDPQRPTIALAEILDGGPMRE
jgi:hypothetical protein